MTLVSTAVDSRLNFFLREMAPAPGRTAGALRFALSTALASLLLLILQPPPFTIAPSLFILFLVSHDTPYNCARDLTHCLSGALVGTMVALGLVIATGNHPMARVLGLAVFTFLSGFFFRASTVPIAALSFGSLSFMVTSLWENQARAEAVLHLSLWPLGTVFTVACSAAAVDFLFNSGAPMKLFRREIKARFESLEQLFEFGATHPLGPELQRQIEKVRRYAVTSQASMHGLLEQVLKSPSSGVVNREELSGLLLLLSRLLDIGAEFAANHGFEEQSPERLERISHALAAARREEFAQIPAILGPSPSNLTVELDRFEQTLHAMSTSQAQAQAQAGPAPNVAGRAKQARRSWFVPDAFTNRRYADYAFKLSLCATLCYVIYNGLKWPGISTAYFTVLFTGLTTTGFSNRKLAFRVVGSTIGGIVLGLGALVFVFPNIESVAPFLLVIAAISFLGIWIAGSSYYGYIGLQIAFSFNLLAFETYSAATEMTPARDRILGIFLGLIVMLLIFHQIRPERTVDTMRMMLARLLRAEAALIGLLKSAPPDALPTEQVVQLRAGIGQLVVGLRTFADVVGYEFEPDRSADLATSSQILNAASTSASLMLSSHVDSPVEGDEAAPLRELHDGLQAGLQELASALEKPEESAVKVPADFARLLNSPSAERPKFIGKTLASFRELQMLCEGIAAAEA